MKTYFLIADMKVLLKVESLKDLYLYEFCKLFKNLELNEDTNEIKINNQVIDDYIFTSLETNLLDSKLFYNVDTQELESLQTNKTFYEDNKEYYQNDCNINTFEEYLHNCMFKNGGVLFEVEQ